MSRLDQHVREELRPADERTVAEWAADTIVLDEVNNAEPGPLRIDRTPYVAGVLAAFRDRAVSEITLMWSTQTGKTMSELIMLAWSIDQDPGPAMFVQPIEALARRFNETRIVPMIMSSPALAQHVHADAWSVKSLEIHFDRMNVYLAWANSPATLASQPVQRVFLDEVDKYPPASRKEASPLKLARERVKTFKGKSKVIKSSTPTTAEGVIYREWLKSARHRYHVPCPHCGEMQPLEWARVKWPDGERNPDRLRNERLGLAWYECRACRGRIEDRHKPAMLRAGQWLVEGDVEDPGHVGFHLSALYSPWVTFGALAAEFLDSKDDRETLQNFINSNLAEPFEDRTAAVVESAVDRLRARSAAAHQRGMLPVETQLVAAFVDWHGPRLGYYWAAWAVWHGRSAALVDYGQAFSLDDLERDLVTREWATADGVVWTGPVMGAADSGWGEETAAVYAWTRERYPRWRPAKGVSTVQAMPVQETGIDYLDRRTGRRFKGFSLLRIFPGFFKDMIASAIGLEDEEPKITLCRGVGEDFLACLTAQHKVKRGTREEWVPRYHGAPDHWWDASVGALAVAERWGWARMVERGDERRASAPARSSDEPRRSGWVTRGQGWRR